MANSEDTATDTTVVHSNDHYVIFLSSTLKIFVSRHICLNLVILVQFISFRVSFLKIHGLK